MQRTARGFTAGTPGPLELEAVLPGPSVTAPVVDGRPRPGTWQSFIPVERDGSRGRRLHITVR